MILFFDRNTGSRLPRALNLLGVPVEYHAKHFRHDTPDDVWLPKAGQEQWTVVTHDRNFIFNESEMRAIADHRVGCLVFAGGGNERWTKVRLLARAWDRIMTLVSSETPPYIWAVDGRARLRRLFP